MTREKLANKSYSYLNSSVNATTTTFVVNDGSVYPTDGQFHMRVGDEIVLVTDVSTNTLTVERGKEGTSASSHSANDLAIQILSNESFEKLLKDNILYAFEKPAEGRLINQGVPISLGDFIWINQDDGSIKGEAEEDGETITITTSLTSSDDLRGICIYAPTGNFTATMSAVMSNSLDRYSNQSPSHGGMFLRENSTGKIVAFGIELRENESLRTHTLRKYDSALTVNSVYTGNFAPSVGTGICKYQRISYDGSNYSFEFTADGVNWTTAYTTSDDDFLTSKADQIGFYVDTNTRSQPEPIKMSVSHFVVE
jgi:hypothetical protein